MRTHLTLLNALEFTTTDVWAVTVDGSAPLLLNAPEVWSVHGDLGNTSTPGGWARLIGRGLALGQSTDHVDSTVLSLANRLADAVRRGKRADATDLSATLSRALSRDPSATAAASTVLRLTPVGGGEAVLLSASESSNFSATFLVPTTLAVAQYTAAVSNNGGGLFVNISTFRSPAQPRVSTITVRAPLAFKNDTFVVERPPAGHRVSQKHFVLL
jgi:hypothetical protein